MRYKVRFTRTIDSERKEFTTIFKPINARNSLEALESLFQSLSQASWHNLRKEGMQIKSDDTGEPVWQVKLKI